MNRAAPDGPFDGVPGHLQHGLIHWWRSVAEHSQSGFYAFEVTLRELAAFLRVNVDPEWDADELGEYLVATATQNDEVMLDLIDGTLRIFGRAAAVDRLVRLLDLAGSVWTVSPDHLSLVSVVSDESQTIFNASVSVEDEASGELKVAWANAFGRNGNPSDAWDHAIKAMEALFIPLVVPNQTKPNLGHVLGQLRNQGNLWKMVLPGKDDDNDVAPLASMLEGIWPNIDRHQGTVNNRPPTEPEARAVVTLAATIVQWHREGWVLQRR